MCEEGGFLDICEGFPVGVSSGDKACDKFSCIYINEVAQILTIVHTRKVWSII